MGFDIPDVGVNAQVVHSLAKWKRLALKRYEFNPGKGLFTDMNAIRRDEEVGQPSLRLCGPVGLGKGHHAERTGDVDVSQAHRARHRAARSASTSDAARRRTSPSLTRSSDRGRVLHHHPGAGGPVSRPDPQGAGERDPSASITAVFLMQIGGKLKSGKPHDGSAPDYDDWALNGDILMWNPVLECAFEISSMGIRVDAEMPRPPAEACRLRGARRSSRSTRCF